MIKVGYYVKNKELEKKIQKLSYFNHEYLVYELYSDDVEEIRNAFPVRVSRKKDLYKKIYNYIVSD